MRKLRTPLVWALGVGVCLLLLWIDQYSAGVVGSCERHEYPWQEVLAVVETAALSAAGLSALPRRWGWARIAFVGELLMFVTANTLFLRRDGWGRFEDGLSPSLGLIVLFGGAVVLRVLLGLQLLSKGTGVTVSARPAAPDTSAG